MPNYGGLVCATALLVEVIRCRAHEALASVLLCVYVVEWIGKGGGRS